MKKHISSPVYLLILPPFALLFSFYTLSCVITTAEAVTAGDMTKCLMGILNFLWCLVLASVFFFALNRVCCVVWVEDGSVQRRGLFGGFRKTVPIQEIQNIQIINLRREGKKICLIDGGSHGFDRMRKDSYICLNSSRRNMEFIRSFWSGEIKENPILF